MAGLWIYCVCNISNLADLPSITIVYEIAEQFDKSGLAISQ